MALAEGQGHPIAHLGDAWGMIILTRLSFFPLTFGWFPVGQAQMEARDQKSLLTESIKVSFPGHQVGCRKVGSGSEGGTLKLSITTSIE